MARFLSAEWMAMAREKAGSTTERPGVSARLQHVVTGGPDGDVRYFAVIEDGRTLEQSLGDDPDAQVTMTSTYADSVRIARGELDANAALMQGRVKVAGDMGQVLSIMPLTQSTEHRSVQEQVLRETEF
jgi:putative sterol carrier protein